jgi:TolB-like protein
VIAVTSEVDDPYAPTAPGSGPRAPESRSEPGLVGRRVGVYEILEQVGSGGMGIVYRAKDRSLDREVALKVLQPYLSQDPEYERRFVREARTAAKLDHPNIVQVYTAGRYESVLFIAMQFVKGKTLHQFLKSEGKTDWRKALQIARQAAEALGAAHGVGLVHRDIKPNNIMIDESGRVKIMDFGLMRSNRLGEAITQQGDFFGTPEYASPEQCETAELDGRSDLYSLGAVLYEMLTGRMPHKAETPLALFKKILNEEPAPIRSLSPDVPPAVEDLVRKMMAKKPSDRFAHAAELVAEIDRVLAGGPAARRAPSARRGTGWPVVAALGALAIVLGLVYAGRAALRGRAPTAMPPAGERLKLLVFDLKNGTPDANTDWYEIALADLLIASLSQQPFLEVPTRDSLLWTYGGTKLNEKPVHAGAGASAYLSGKYYVRGGKLRLTLACYRLPENAPAFPPRTYEKSEGELFALVDEASAGVARELERVASTILARATPAVQARPCQELALSFRGGAASREEDREEEKPLALAARPKENLDGKDLRKAGTEEARAPAAAAPAAPSPLAGQGLAQAKSPGAEAAGHARRSEPKAGPERGRPALPALSDPELQKAWYQNRQVLEACKFEKEEFEALLGGLREQFRAGEFDAASWKKGVENFQEGMSRAREARQKAGPRAGRPAVEFACPGCGGTRAEFGRCDPCDRYLILRIRIPEGQEKKP